MSFNTLKFFQQHTKLYLNQVRTFQQNGYRNSGFHTTVWSWMKIKAIQASLKVLSSDVCYHRPFERIWFTSVHTHAIVKGIFYIIVWVLAWDKSIFYIIIWVQVWDKGIFYIIWVQVWRKSVFYILIWVQVWCKGVFYIIIWVQVWRKGVFYNNLSTGMT